MSIDVIRSPESIRDVENIARYFLEQKTPATALKFGRAVTRTLDLLSLFPEMGAVWESERTRLKGVRFMSLRRFKNYLIFYRLTDSAYTWKESLTAGATLKSRYEQRGIQDNRI